MSFEPTNESEHPHLEALIGGYFHQDWDVFWPTWQDIVRQYRSDATAWAVKKAAEEIRLLLETRNDSQIDFVLYNRFGCAYDPGPDQSLRDWLTQVAGLLELPLG